MGYVRHRALVVTVSSGDDLVKVEAAVDDAGLSDLYAGPVCSRVNGYITLVVGPDGSKEGWDESIHGDSQLQHLCKWLDAQRYEDGSTSFQWAVVAYGSDDMDASVERHAWGYDARR